MGLFGALSPANALMTTPAQFEDQPVVSLSNGTSLAFTPDGRLLITVRGGFLRVYKNGALLPTPALSFPTTQICFNIERGLLGVGVDPSFASNHHIYLYYTFNKYGDCATSGSNTPVNRVSRFTLGDNDVVDPASETVLIDNIPSPTGMHNAGDVQFGKDGNLYVSVGDGGCDFRGDSGCGPVNDAARDLAGLSGKVLRITPTGGIPAGNPYQGLGTQRCNVDGGTTAPTKCQEIYSWGLRNPFRLAFDPNAAGTLFYINDVGLAKWEEIDIGASGADYGWNMREGPCATDSYTDCGPPLPGGTNPLYSYPHTTGCASITGGAFVPTGQWTPALDDAYLFGDLVCGKIFKMTPAGGGYTAVSDFATPIGTNWIISMTMGPHAGGTALYYITWNDGSTHEVRRIAYTGPANRSPVARATASPTHGNLPLDVSFDGTGSFDPDGDPLSYDWDFGDGSAHGSGATTSHTYTTSGVYTVTLTVSDGRGLHGQTTLQIDSDNDAPTPVIDAPASSKLFRVGETITLEGHATDPEDGPLPETALTFEVIKRHDTHFHPYFPPTQGDDFTITAPEPEDINSTQNSYLEIILTATDSNGLSTTIRQELRPHLIDTTFLSSPGGLKVQVAGSTFTTPRTIASWEGWNLAVNTWNQATSAGTPYDFSSWSDGGAISHTITTPSSGTGYLASFTPGGYARPLSGTPATFRFVPAFRPCSAPNGTHNEPLSLPSCNEPTQESDTLTLGGPDTTGFAPAGTSLATMTLLCNDGAKPPCPAAGDTEDIAIRVAITDVHCRDITACPGPGVGADYAGSLLATTNIRMTDRLNGTFGNAAGTASDQPISIPIECTATPTDLMAGSNCNVDTTVDSLYPGLVREQSRAVWELGSLVILDSGPNGTGFGGNCPPTCGDGDEQVFMRQGLFVP